MPETLAVLVRWMYILGMSLLVGLFGFRWLVARPSVREGGREAGAAFAALDAQVRSIATGALIVTVLAGVLDLWRQVSVATGASLWSVDAHALGAVLAHTRYGWVWLSRQGCLILLGVWCVIQFRGHGGEPRLGSDVSAGLLTAVALLVGTAASHAASAQGWPLVAMTVDAAHLLATGLWFGGLLPLALSLGHVRCLPPRLAARVAAVGARHFSQLALLSVSTLVATGVYNAWTQVATIPALVGTSYGRWLLLKIGLLLAVLVLAASNRYRLVPRLTAASAPKSGGDAPETVRRLRRQVLAELAIGSAILGVVAVLGLTTPARHAQPTWPFAYRLSWTTLQTLPEIPPEVTTGGVMAFFGVLLILGAAFVPAWRAGYLVAGGVVALLAGLGIAAPPFAIDAYPTTYRRPAVPYVTTSIAAGAALYRDHCAACHGSAGHGDGPAAAGLDPKPASLTAPHTGDHTAGDLFWWLSHGIPGSAMPGFADRLSESDRWDLINFVRALASGEQARMLSPDVAPRPSVVAPDLTFGLPTGETRSLKDYRGRAVVLLVFFMLPESRDRLIQLNRIYPAVRDLGAEVVAIPIRGGAGRSTALGDLGFPVTWDADDDVGAVYGLLGRDPGSDGPVAQDPRSHMEFLVDRQGYMRVRWPAKGATGWEDTTRLLAAIRELAREPAQVPAPAEHVH